MEKQGYTAVPYSCTYFWHHRKQEGVDFDHAATFSHMNAFVAAGLGEYGWHGMVMSPEYGPRQRIVSVFTTAPLVPDPLYDGEPLCDRCKLCERVCWGENYKCANLLKPETISFEIEGKTFEYANINRWRCFWGEQCHLDMGELAKREDLDEAGIYDALDSGVARSVNGPAGYMCSSFKHCMAKPVRYFDRSHAPNPLRKKTTPESNWSQLKELIFEKAQQVGADRIAILPLEDNEALRQDLYEGFRTDELLRTFKWIICLGRALSQTDTMEDNALVEKNRDPCRRLTIGRLMTGTCDIARALDDLGYETLQMWGQNGTDRAAEQAGWDTAEAPLMLQSLVCAAPLEKVQCLLSAPFASVDSPEMLLKSTDTHAPHIDQIGVADLNDLAAPVRDSLQTLVPHAKSLIVLGVQLSERTVELAGKQEAECAVSYQQISYQSMRESFWAAQDLAGTLESQGYAAVPLFDVDPDSKGRPQQYVGYLPDLRAQAPYAAAAGLGFIGKSGFLISPEFGPRQRFSFILTDAPLPSSPRANGACPNGCTACQDACPVQALRDTGSAICERHDDRCTWARVMGMVAGEGSSLSGWTLPDLPVPDQLDDKQCKQALAQKDPIQVHCYNNANHGDTQIERCLQACPLGFTVKSS